mmetsp:Transcript_21050/g.45064  ORF Transcript_21050/g.45064 Transcript_21050/m.45064 type:complete len:453 (+) Transcript_21050:136-1494(+)|eukprot:CAMPEP_0172553296 /NCGR_PEP_ID=MMETSP1067-20121228/49947_1 /TAXON_ID=265564 ORGANISM="Thalassiosira punctigera, Strain Tpunct2005C2" /NCGR_SAMPLE_ID=MMETSP1067 /ASSEMBLY_ACC=CAM_ASM_000444 /LENGTH=452 /DNA_ID=CAMNT_0013341459 /DNA_START=98 /DNA_END=1456 /DNA_ORIENTATION=+
MVTKNIVRKDGGNIRKRDAAIVGEEHLQNPPRSYGSRFAPSHYEQSLAPPAQHQLAPPSRKKAKSTQRNNDSVAFSPGQYLQESGKYGNHPMSSASAPSGNSVSYPYQPTSKRRPVVAPPPAPRILPKPTTARSSSVASRPNPSMQNPYSTSRGLRHFSMKVCEKVEEKGTTTYNEVADELVRELKQAEEAINLAAAARGEEVFPVAKQKKGGSKKSSSGGKKPHKKNHDDKNIRRRVYDALNVLMAMDIITKDKKEITWRGLPGSRVRENDGMGDSSGGTDDNGDRRTNNGMSRTQRVQQLRDELSKRHEDVRRKKECLQELLAQNVCFQNLLGRNHAREVEDGRRRQADSDKGAIAEDVEEKIPLPFIVVNTDSRAVVQCEMCPKRTDVSFDFSLPFEINDDNEILKRLGMNHTSKEALQRSLPPDLFHYCNGKGLLHSIARPREVQISL